MTDQPEFGRLYFMDQKIEFEVVTPLNAEKQIMDFYRSCGRETKLNPHDTVIIARSNSLMIGIVRLCHENGFWVLRTMQVRNDLQGKGIGRIILNKFQHVVRERSIEKVYCMPYEHLEYFYGLIGFQKIDEATSPEFLRERAHDFHNRNPDKCVILMST